MNIIVAIIPSRSGSEWIPNKNTASCAGYPLLGYICAAALQSQKLDRLVLSTNGPEIPEVVRSCGIEGPFFREGKLAQDDTMLLPVIQNMLDWLDPDGETVEAKVLLQPKLPLRQRP